MTTSERVMLFAALIMSACALGAAIGVGFALKATIRAILQGLAG